MKFSKPAVERQELIRALQDILGRLLSEENEPAEAPAPPLIPSAVFSSPEERTSRFHARSGRFCVRTRTAPRSHHSIPEQDAEGCFPFP